MIYQIGALQALARAAGSTVSYVKPHGALYNTIVTHEGRPRAVAEAVHAVDPGLPVLGLAGSAFFAAAESSGCAPSPRRSPTAPTARRTLVSAPRARRRAARRRRRSPTGCRSMVDRGTVEAVDGTTIPITVGIGLRTRRFARRGADRHGGPRRADRRRRRS